MRGNSNGLDDIKSLNLKAIWQYFKGEHFLLALCGYLIIEYVYGRSQFRFSA